GAQSISRRLVWALSRKLATRGARPSTVRSVSALLHGLARCSGAERRSSEARDGAKCVKELGADRLGALQLDVRLACVACELGGETKNPAPDPLGLSPAPAPGERGGADHVQQLVGERTHGPQQAVAAEVVDRGPADPELGEFLDPVLDRRAPVVEAPGRERMDGFDVGQHVSALRDLAGLKSELARVWPERPPALEREEA